jgi:hypothetical protein
MVSCGYEPTAVMDGFGSLKGLLGMVRGTFRLYPDEQAKRMLDEPDHGMAIPAPARALEETKV